MTVDEQKPAAPQEPGQVPPSAPVTAPQGEAQEQQQATPQYVTKEDLDRFAADVLRRAKQSDRDRARAIEAKLTEITGLLKTTGAQVTPEVEAKLRDQIGSQIDAVEEQPAGTSAVPPAAPSPVDVFLDSVMEDAGAKVTPQDPEWKEVQQALDANWSNPNGMPKVLLAAARAAEAKKRRTAVMQETAPARVGGGGSNITGAPPARSGRDMLSQAFSGRK